MAIDIGEIIRWGLMNFSATMSLLALLFILFDVPFNLATKKNSTADIIFRWVSLFAVGVTGIYAFIMHAFFSNLAAATIGWQNSPFQFEVAMANLAFGMLGVLAFYNNFGFRVAMTIGVTIWLWGDAFGHIYQMVASNNYTIGNAGSWFWLDILIPIILLMCILKMVTLWRKTHH